LYKEKVAGYCLFHSHPFADTPAAIARREREKRVVLAGKKGIMYPGNIRKMYAPHNLAKMCDEIERSDQIASQTPDEGIISVLNGMISRPSRLQLMERGDSPLLWILGLHDQYIDYKDATDVVKLPLNATLVTLYETGHLGFIEEPERSVVLLTDFAFKIFGEEFRA
jgi:pimeloyl-ACP methyl ester carboxylesterase